MDLETQVRRLEQQLSAFEKLHANELKDFQEKLAAYMRLQADEVRQLHEQLAELRRAVEARTAAPVPPSPPANAEETSL
jgi:hypothetical protein